jgi:hypothetical protein
MLNKGRNYVICKKFCPVLSRRSERGIYLITDVADAAKQLLTYINITSLVLRSLRIDIILKLIMQNNSRLFLLKFIHTVIWVFYNIVIFYMLFAVLSGKLDARLWICYALVALEGLILLWFRWTCPITIVARRYSADTVDNFDIFLPNWLAKHTKTIYSVLVAVIIVLTVYRLLSGKR